MKVELYIQKDGAEVSQKSLVDKTKEIWQADGNKIKDMTSLDLYFNANENTCYYVINGENKGSFGL
jgi:hypothetical protein